MIDNHKASITVTPVLIDSETFKVRMEMSFQDRITEFSEMTVRLQEQVIRDGLIALGWTPPGQKK